MEEIRLVHTILKSTNSGGSLKLTKSFLLNNGFKMCANKIAIYNKKCVKVYIYFDVNDDVKSLFTEKPFKYKDAAFDYDWYYPKTIKEFLDIFNEYKKYIQHNSQFDKSRKSWILQNRDRN